MRDSQKEGKSSPSGGQKIDDHSFWGGGMSQEAVLAKGSKFKQETSAVGAGNLPNYEDTTEKIKEQQVKGVGKIHSHPRRPLERN